MERLVPRGKFQDSIPVRRIPITGTVIILRSSAPRARKGSPQSSALRCAAFVQTKGLSTPAALRCKPWEIPLPLQLLPVRHLQQWIEHNILLELASAPFSKADAQLVPEAGSCVECPKRTGHNKLLFADMGTGQKDSCSDPKCYAAKLDAHIRQTIAAKPKLVQISTGYGQQKEGSTTLPRNKYVEVRQEKPKTKEE